MKCISAVVQGLDSMMVELLLALRSVTVSHFRYIKLDNEWCSMLTRSLDAWVELNVHNSLSTAVKGMRAETFVQSWHWL